MFWDRPLTQKWSHTAVLFCSLFLFFFFWRSDLSFWISPFKKTGFNFCHLKHFDVSEETGVSSTGHTGLLRPLLGLNWFNWSWTGLESGHWILVLCGDNRTFGWVYLLWLDFLFFCRLLSSLCASDWGKEQRGWWVIMALQQMLKNRCVDMHTSFCCFCFLCYVICLFFSTFSLDFT